MTAHAAFGYAPGKIILLGEHAVVYGQPALAATLDRGMRVAITRAPAKSGGADQNGPVLRGTGFGIDAVARPDPGGEGPEALRRALSRLIEMFGERVRDLSFSVDGQIPAGSGLGSSAALSVALVRGVHRFFEEEVPPEQVRDEALSLEKVFHGNPSGVDHNTILTGGLVCFTSGVDRTLGKAGQKEATQERAAEPTVTALPLPRRLRFAVGIAGHHAGTSHAVSALRDRMQRHPTAYAHLYAGIGNLVEEAKGAIAEGHWGALGELMDLNQGYLNALGVSTPAIEALCAMARQRGALGAKLSGAGGGGAVIALVDDDPAGVVRAYTDAGYEGFCVEIDANQDEAKEIGAAAAAPQSVGAAV